MDLLWSDTRWVSKAARAALERALEIRRTGARRDLSEDELRTSFRGLCDEAVGQGKPPEAVVEVFRETWDHWFSRRHGDDPRDLLYYGTLSQCLDIYFERARQDAPWRDGAASESGRGEGLR